MAKERQDYGEGQSRSILEEYKSRVTRRRFGGRREIRERAMEEIAHLWLETPGQVMKELIEENMGLLPRFVAEEEGRGFMVLHGIGNKIFPSYFCDNEGNLYHAMGERGYLGDTMWPLVRRDRDLPTEAVIEGLNEAVADKNKLSGRLTLSPGFYVFEYDILESAWKERYTGEVTQVVKADSLVKAAEELPGNINTLRQVNVHFAQKGTDAFETVARIYDVEKKALVPIS